MRRAERYKRTPEYRSRVADVHRHFHPTLRGSLGQEIKPDRDLARAVAFKRTEAYRDALKAAAFARALRAPNTTAVPAMKVLEQTLRPIHAIAGAAREDVRDIKAGRLPIGHGSLRAAGRGLTLKDKYLFSDVLKEAGVRNKTILALAGTTLDVGLDPTSGRRSGPRLCRGDSCSRRQSGTRPPPPSREPRRDGPPHPSRSRKPGGKPHGLSAAARCGAHSLRQRHGKPPARPRPGAACQCGGWAARCRA